MLLESNRPDSANSQLGQIISFQGDMAEFSCYLEIKINIVGVKVQTDYRKNKVTLAL